AGVVGAPPAGIDHLFQRKDRSGARRGGRGSRPALFLGASTMTAWRWELRLAPSPGWPVLLGRRVPAARPLRQTTTERKEQPCPNRATPATPTAPLPPARRPSASARWWAGGA